MRSVFRAEPRKTLLKVQSATGIWLPLLRQLREMKRSDCTNQTAISCTSTGTHRWPKHPTTCKFQHICRAPFAIANIAGTKRRISLFEQWKWYPGKGMRLPFWASQLKNLCPNSKHHRTSAANERIKTRFFTPTFVRDLNEKRMQHNVRSH